MARTLTEDSDWGLVLCVELDVAADKSINHCTICLSIIYLGGLQTTSLYFTLETNHLNVDRRLDNSRTAAVTKKISWNNENH